MAGPNYLLMAAAAVGGLLLVFVIWSFLSNAQFGLTLLAAKESTGFFPFMGTFFLYTLGFYFIVLFIALVAGVIYVEVRPKPVDQQNTTST
jgi:hypothetical protein